MKEKTKEKMKMRKLAGTFFWMLLFPFALFAQETETVNDFDDVIVEQSIENDIDDVIVEQPAEGDVDVVVMEQPEDTADVVVGPQPIDNNIDAVIGARPGDYIILLSGNRYVLTREEILIASDEFNWDDISSIEPEIRENGIAVRTVSQAHEVVTYPDGEVVHVLKTTGAYRAFMYHVRDKYHIMRYLDPESGILRESVPLDSPEFDVFRAFVQFEAVSNGFEELDCIIVTAFNYERRNFTERYSSAQGLVWGMVSSVELQRAAAEPEPTVPAEPEEITEVPSVRPISELPVSATVLPSPALREIGNRTIKVGDAISLLDLTAGRSVTSWESSTPAIVSVDENGNVSGLNIGNSFITINDNEYISVAVVPQEAFYVVPESESVLLPEGSRTSGVSSSDLTEYRTEPTFRLAFRFNNKGENKGASGPNGGLDILGRGANYEWLWTTYYQGGWFYNLNDVMGEMTDGYQIGDNGVALTVQPEFVYDDGVPYLQLRHYLQNNNDFAVTGQKFGASADVMIHDNDYAPLILTEYGAYMTDNPDNPSLELMFICLSGNGINSVDTLWLGTWNEGHLAYIFSDRRADVYNEDSAVGFSYQNIDLSPGEIKQFVVRFTLARINN